MPTESTVKRFLNSPVSFYTSIISFVIIVCGIYYGITMKIELLAQRMETHIESTSYMQQQMSINTTKIAVLESKL
jgi:hypothetical protein